MIRLEGTNPSRNRESTVGAHDIHIGQKRTQLKLKLAWSKGGVQNTKLQNRSCTFEELCLRLSKPKLGEKDGSYYVRGPVNNVGIRCKKNISAAYLVILDADSSLDPKTGEITEGAPDPFLVHNVLRSLGIKHLLYSSHSHGVKGNRYRVLIAPNRPITDKAELAACVDALIDKLHKSVVPLHLANENYGWAQPWYFPRTNNPENFIFLKHTEGALLSVDDCLKFADQDDRTLRKVAIKAVRSERPKTVKDSGSVIDNYNKTEGNAPALLKRLVGNGYVLSGQAEVNGKTGYRLLAPESSSKKPGVILFASRDGVWRVYSHHSQGSDPLAETGLDGARHALDAFDVFRILVHGGDFAKALAAVTPPKPTIEIHNGSLGKTVRRAIHLIGQATPPIIFQRGSMLVRVAHLPEAIDIEGCSVPKGTAVMVGLVSADFGVRLSDIAQWQRQSGTDKGGNPIWKPIDPPSNVISGILAAQGDWRAIPLLRSIAEPPIFRPDGSLHDGVGYDQMTGLYYEGGCPPLNLPCKPNRAEARAAAKKLLKVFREFPLVDRSVARSVTLAYIFTLLLRGQLPLAPLFAISATAPGTGKGLLVELCNLLARGRDAAIMPPVSGNGAEEETRKRITALLLRGVTSVNLDNWVTAIGGESLNGLLTATEWTDRVLGESKTVKLPNQVTWAATGNNLTVRGDMVRRTLLIQMDAQEERPELRTFIVKNIMEYVLRHRAELLSAAFTILRAYALAGRPEVEGTPLGRFETWWRAVCAPIIWIGGADPVSSQEKLRAEDPEMSKLARLVGSWHRVFGAEPVGVADLTQAIEGGSLMSEDNNDLRDSLMECAGERGQINPRSLGWYLKRFSGRIVDSLRLQRTEGSSHSKPKYYVETIE